VAKDKKNAPDFDALDARARRKLAGHENAAQWPVGCESALAKSREEAEKAYAAMLKETGSRAKAEEAYEVTYGRTYERERVRGGFR